MKDVLLSKLAQALDKELDEAEVVYILVTIRKLIQLERSKKQFDILLFFMDWAVHSSLDRGRAREVVRRFDKLYTSTLKQKLEELEQTINQLAATVNIQDFRITLSCFLVGHNLPDDICQDQGRWYTFASCYSNIIEGTPLEFGPTRPKRGDHVAKVIVSIGKGKTQQMFGGPDNALELQWKVFTSTGRQVALHLVLAAAPKEGLDS